MALLTRVEWAKCVNSGCYGTPGGVAGDETTV